MKKKMIDLLSPLELPKGYKAEWGTTAQTVHDGADDILILNVYKKRKLLGRHCLNIRSGEYATWLNGKPETKSPYPMVATAPVWTSNRVGYIYCEGSTYESQYLFHYGRAYDVRTRLAGKVSEDLVYKLLKLKGKTKTKENSWEEVPSLPNWRIAVDRLEDDYARDQRIGKEERRVKRVCELMDMVPPEPRGLSSWAYDQMFGGVPGTATYDTETQEWYCSECHDTADRKKYLDENGKPAGMNKLCKCPSCGAQVILHRKSKYNKVIRYTAKFVNFSPIDDDISVVRYYDAEATTDSIDKYPGSRGKSFVIRENIRVILYKQLPASQILELRKIKNGKNKTCRIFYTDYHGFFDYKSNPMHRYMSDCICYEEKPGQIAETLKDTAYEHWVRVFEASAAAGQKIDYNRCMCAIDKRVADVSEMLMKGRFRKLFAEYVADIDVWSGKISKYGTLNLNEYGRNANKVLMLKDTQAVNRLRDMNGDGYTLKWLRSAEKSGKKISQEALRWYSMYRINPTELDFVPAMSPDQCMNYIKRQQAESYPTRSYQQVLNTWADYMRMAKDLNKKLNDEMIYRPKSLKLRHDEYAEECNRKRKLIQARHDREYAKEQKKKLDAKFPDARKILKDIKAKFEWSNNEYIIVVPDHLTDIIFEGQQLHHCAGATDRYFDRICQRETYIVFLRKAAAPKEPYYTIEVEPGGAIRQHRGMYDEEPEIELVKPALKEWQKEIRKRMKEEDRKAAEISKKKRAENIKELEEKKNLRVLKALMDDFMDIEDIEAEEERSKTEETEHKKAGKGKEKDSGKTVKTKKIRKIA